MGPGSARHSGVWWLPATAQILGVVLLIAPSVWLLRRARPGRIAQTVVAAFVVAVAATAATWWSLRGQRLAADPPPDAMWVWVALSAAAVVLLVVC